jgi:hypothetical protein
MKLSSYIFLLFSIQIFSQVGIGTTDPTASLDINGNLRIRSIIEETNPKIATDSVLVMSRDGTVNRIASKVIYESNIKTAIRGSFSGSGNISLTLGSNVATIPFNTLDFDTNSEFNTTTYTFTAKQDGIYQVYAQINSAGALGASTNYGIQILKGSTVIAQQNFANININIPLTINLNLTPPIRSVQTLVQLNANETIKFQLFTNLASATLLGSKSDSFFSIYQIR